MLILARKMGESVRISNDIEIEILEIKHNKVRLGFTAPTQIPIHREEIYQRIKDGIPKGYAE